jgi:hypothetical protein
MSNLHRLTCRYATSLDCGETFVEDFFTATVPASLTPFNVAAVILAELFFVVGFRSQLSNPGPSKCLAPRESLRQKKKERVNTRLRAFTALRCYLDFARRSSSLDRRADRAS